MKIGCDLSRPKQKSIDVDFKIRNLLPDAMSKRVGQSVRSAVKISVSGW